MWHSLEFFFFLKSDKENVADYASKLRPVEGAHHYMPVSDGMPLGP